MEIVKAVIYEREKVEVGYKYLAAIIVISDQPIEGLENEMVIMGGQQFAAPITETLNSMKKYKLPYKGGTISQSIVQVSNMKPTDLEEIKPKVKKKKRGEALTIFCGHCKKDTSHIFIDGGHERDSSGDYQQCKKCKWEKYGFQKEYQPPSKD